MKGQPIRFVDRHQNGFQNRGKPHSAEAKRRISEAKLTTPSARYEAIHVWLLNNHPKTGICERCGKSGKTDHAYRHHPHPYTRNRDDYKELCRSCHKTAYPQSAETRKKISQSMKRARAEKFWSTKSRKL